MSYPMPSDAQLEMLILEVEQAIMNYCNISKVPEALKYVWANMVVDYWRWIVTIITDNATEGDSTNAPGSSTTATMVASVKEGDTTVSYVADSSTSASSVSYPGNAHSMQGVLDKVIMNYVDSLNKFRRIEW